LTVIRSSTVHRTNYLSRPAPGISAAGSDARLRLNFNVWSEAKRIAKLRYIHRNPMWRDSCRVLNSGVERLPSLSFGSGRLVEIEPQWTARERELLGVVLQIAGGQIPAPSSGFRASSGLHRTQGQGRAPAGIEFGKGRQPLFRTTAVLPVSPQACRTTLRLLWD
jgi:hypothetical protein